MTLTTETARMDYVGTGSTGPFSYSFRIFDALDLEVTTRSSAGVETTLVYPTDYTVTGVRNRAGGTITLTTALAVGETLTIRRVMAFTQPTDLRNLGAFLPEVLEDQFDRVVMITQQLEDGIERSMRFPVSVDPDAVSAVLPAPSPNLILGWNAAGTALENFPLASSDNVVLPGGGRTVPTLTNYLANNVVFNILDFNPSPATPLTTGLNSINAAYAATIAALPARGGRVLFPPGDLMQTANLVVAPDHTAFNGGYIELVFAPGARLRPTAAVTEAISFLGDVSQNAWVGATNPVIDGQLGSATLIGFGIHAPNVKLESPTVQYCGGEGVKYFATNAPSYPINSEIRNYYALFNKIGLHCAVGASGLKMFGGRIEGSDEEGAYFDNCGHIGLHSVIIETNGYVTASKPNLKIKNSVNGSIHNCYFESLSGQNHTCVDIEGDTAAVFSLSFIGNRVVNGNSLGNALSIGVNIGSSAGAVEGWVSHSNEFVGQTVAVRTGTNLVAYKIGPDYFTDNFNPAGSAHTRYQMVSTRPGIVYDINRYANTIYTIGIAPTAGSFTTLAASGLIDAQGGIKYTGGTSVDGSTVKSATLGYTMRGITGSQADGAFTGAGGVAVWQNITGTQVFEVFATIKQKRATIAYSASMTPDADAGELQTITVTNATAFTINAPTNPRIGQTLRIRTRNISGGAHGAVTVNAIFKLAGGAWPVVANGSSKTLVVDYDGTNWVEQTRSAADVPN
jgi:hypothetical protein